jgi:hypothetical protein
LASVLIWKTLFIDHSPYSEACRGVLTALDKFGLDVSSRNLNEYRKFFETGIRKRERRLLNLGKTDSLKVPRKTIA